MGRKKIDPKKKLTRTSISVEVNTLILADQLGNRSKFFRLASKIFLRSKEWREITQDRTIMEGILNDD